MKIVLNTKNKIIKVIVRNKTNPYWFDMFIDKIENSNPTDMQIIEDSMQLFDMDANEAINEAEDTITMFKSYIGQLGIDLSKRDKLEKAIVDLYQEAIAIQ